MVLFSLVRGKKDRGKATVYKYSTMFREQRWQTLSWQESQDERPSP